MTYRAHCEGRKAEVKRRRWRQILRAVARRIQDIADEYFEPIELVRPGHAANVRLPTFPKLPELPPGLELGRVKNADTHGSNVDSDKKPT